MDLQEAMDKIANRLGGDGDPQTCLERLLALETPEDAERIRAALEPDWEKDWAAAFNRAARKVFGR